MDSYNKEGMRKFQDNFIIRGLTSFFLKLESTEDKFLNQREVRAAAYFSRLSIYLVMIFVTDCA